MTMSRKWWQAAGGFKAPLFGLWLKTQRAVVSRQRFHLPRSRETPLKLADLKKPLLRVGDYRFTLLPFIDTLLVLNTAIVYMQKFVGSICVMFKPQIVSTSLGLWVLPLLPIPCESPKTGLYWSQRLLFSPTLVSRRVNVVKRLN